MTTPPHMSGWWGGYGRGEDRLSLLDLIRNGTLDVQMAALLWGLVERKTSIIVAAGPQRAGKTTLLSALMDFAPPQFERVYTRGIYEDFSFLPHTDPARTYILIPELSDHTPAYLWGIRVQTLFDALARGYSMAATMHADTPEQVLRMLAGHPVYIPRERLHHAGVVVNLLMLYGGQGIARRVSMITRITPGPGFETLAEWDDSRDSYVLTSIFEDAEMARRVKTLETWLDRGDLDADEVRELVAEYYRKE